MLAEAGYEVDCASGGVEALEIISNEAPACILLDLYMDDKSGLDVLMEIREILDKETCPVVMVSAENDESSVGVALEFGANDFLFKPVSAAVLRSKLANLLAPAAAKPGLAAAPQSLEPHQRLGRYRIERLLRESGDEALYLAQDERLQREVWVKVSGSAEYEATALARVSDARVIAVYDFEAEPFPYLVTERIDGEPLAALTRCPSLSEALRWTYEALRGARALHAQGLIHTGINPTTVNLTRAGHVCLSDLGAAVLFRGLPLGGSRQVSSSPTPYSPPELHDGDLSALTPSADLYSITALLQFLVTAEDRELPPELEPIVERGLSPDPAERFQRADELGAALALALKNLIPTQR